MKVSAKARYALAAMVYMAARYGSGENISILSISENLDISKIYLEQIFSVLRGAELVRSVKGASGGYVLSSPPDKITAYDILLAAEPALFEKAGDTVKDKAPHIEKAMGKLVFGRADNLIEEGLKSVTLATLKEEAEFNKNPECRMFYI